MEIDEDFEQNLKHSLLDLEDYINIDYPYSHINTGVLETNHIRGLARQHKSKEELRFKKRTAITYKECYIFKFQLTLNENIESLNQDLIDGCIDKMNLLLQDYGNFNFKKIIYYEINNLKKCELFIELIHIDEWRFSPVVIESTRIE